jgi:hypothetical protein
MDLNDQNKLYFNNIEKGFGEISLIIMQIRRKRKSLCHFFM